MNSPGQLTGRDDMQQEKWQPRRKKFNKQARQLHRLLTIRALR